MARARSKGEPPDEIDILVGRRICELRTLAGLSQTQLGESVGISFQQIQKYERGINRISASKLYLLASYLGITVSVFFDHSDLNAAHNEAYDFQNGFTNFDITEPYFRSRTALTFTRNYMRIKDAAPQRALKNIILACAGE